MPNRHISIYLTNRNASAFRMILSLVKGNLALFCLMYTSNISKILAISVRYFKTFSTLAKHFVQTPAFQGMSVTSCMVFFFLSLLVWFSFFFYHFLHGFLFLSLLVWFSFFITSCMFFLSVNPSYSLEIFFTASFPSLFFFRHNKRKPTKAANFNKAINLSRCHGHRHFGFTTRNTLESFVPKYLPFHRRFSGQSSD